MDADHANAFQQRLNQWIASQGFWFQLRHSLSGGGNWSSIFFHLLGLGARVGIGLILLLLVVGVVLVKRVDSTTFVDNLEEKLGVFFHTEETEISGFTRTGSEASIHRLGAVGGGASFFRSLEARNVRFRMGMLDGLVGTWDLEMLDANSIDVEIRSGLSSTEDVEAVVGQIFEMPAGVELQGIRVAQARLTWGYYERAFGGIEGSQLTMIRNGVNWRCTFKGGTFSQNWLRGLEIEELVVMVTPQGVKIERGKLLAGEGSAEFRDVEITGAELPRPTGSLVLTRFPLARLMPANAASMMEGRVSGELELGGSTNSSDGITLQGQLNLDGSDYLVLRDDFRVLEALSVVDYYRSYKRVEFDTGTFRLKTGGGTLEISDIDLSSKELMTVEGDLTVRRPTDEEIAKMIGPAGQAMAVGVNPMGDDFSAATNVSLKNAAKAANSDEEDRAEKGVADENIAFYEELDQERRLRREAMDRARGLYFFSGKVRLGIPGDAFERSEALSKRFPVDPATQRIPLDIPLEGGLNDLGTEVAGELLDALR